MIYNLWKLYEKYKGSEEDSNRRNGSKRDSHMVRDCHPPFYEDHLGAGRLKAVSLFAGMRYMRQVMRNMSCICA